MAAPAHNPRLVAWALVAMTLGPSLTGSSSASAQPPSQLADLLTQLQDEFPAVRRNAASALGGLGPAAQDAVPALTELLKDPEGDVRRDTAWALSQLEVAAKDAVEAEP